MDKISNNGNTMSSKREQQIQALNMMPPVIISATLLTPCPFTEKISPINNFLSQKKIINHFNNKNKLNADTFNRTSKELGDETINFIKENKKISLKPISKRIALLLGGLVGLYALTGLLIHNLENKSN